MKYIPGAGLPYFLFLLCASCLWRNYCQPVSCSCHPFPTSAATRLPPSVTVSQTKSFPPLGWLFYLSYSKVASHSRSGCGFNAQPGTRFLSGCCLCTRRRPMQFIGGNELYMASPPPTPKSDKRPLGTHAQMPSFLQILSPSIATAGSVCSEKGGAQNLGRKVTFCSGLALT